MRLRFFYLLLPLLFMGCAQTPTTQPKQNISWNSHQTQLEQLTHWSFTGKLAVITPDQRNSVNIHWQQSGQDFEIYLTTFLGLTVLEIQKKAGETVIIDDSGQRYVSDNSEQLINQLSGMEIPVEYLQQWIKGNPTNAAYQLDEYQRIITLSGGKEDSGIWSINYANYRTINNTNLPHKLQLTRGNLRLKFVISKWQLTH